MVDRDEKASVTEEEILEALDGIMCAGELARAQALQSGAYMFFSIRFDGHMAFGRVPPHTVLENYPRCVVPFIGRVLEYDSTDAGHAVNWAIDHSAHVRVVTPSTYSTSREVHRLAIHKEPTAPVPMETRAVGAMASGPTHIRTPAYRLHGEAWSIEVSEHTWLDVITDNRGGWRLNTEFDLGGK